ncbi:hypothetical protein DV738_g571, partial [Chaetothyriales sp. CBS 135597]
MARPSASLLAIPLPLPFLLPRHQITTSKFQTTVQKRCMGIRSIERPRTDRYQPQYLLASASSALKRKEAADTLPLRTGVMAIKKGMTAIYDEEGGKRVPCTVLQLDSNQVVSHKTKRQHGYFAVCVGSGSKSEKNVTKPMLGHFSAQGVSLKRHLHEFRVRTADALLPVGQVIRADWFVPGQYVDTRSNSKGKGFAGVMKRHGMHGQDRSHGVSLTHRSLGSAGQGQGGGSRVYPGKRMAGRMGGNRHTIQNLKVLQSDPETGILIVNGAVSGPKGCVVVVQDALKKPWPEVPMPASMIQEASGEVSSETATETETKADS